MRVFIIFLLFLTSSCTTEDKNSNTGRFFLAKNRFGPDGIIYPIFMDTSMVKIKVLPSTGETPGEIMAKTAKEQSELLKEKYKEFRTGTNGSK